MQTELVLKISCGEKTCAKEPGKFCEWVTTGKFGSISYCWLWNDRDFRGRPLPLEEEGGWLLRRPECLSAGRKVEDE